MLICMFRKDGRVSGQEQELFSPVLFIQILRKKLYSTDHKQGRLVCKQRIGRNHVVTKSRTLENMLVVARERYIEDCKIVGFKNFRSLLGARR